MKLSVLSALVVTLLVLAPAPAPAQRSAIAPETPAAALKQKLDRGEKVLIIDVREPDEVTSGSILGAINIPLSQLEQRMKDIPKNVQVVFT